MTMSAPKRELTAFDVLVLVEELGGVVGAHVDKVLNPSESELVLRLRTQGSPGLELVVRDGRWLFLRDKEAGEARPPPPFAMLLRKHLENRRLASVGQRGFERIVVLGFDGYELVLELFGDGNVVLVRDGVIVQPLRNQSWEHRVVRPGRTYDYPPARIDPRCLGPDEFSGIVASSKGDLVRTLAVSLNLGGRYAEEICLRTGLDGGTKVGKLSPSSVQRLHSAVRELFSDIAKKREPLLVLDGGTPVDLAPLRLRINEGREQRHFPSLNAAVGQYSAFWQDRRALDERAHRTDEERDRLKRQIESQEKAAGQYREQAALQRRTAEAISASVEELSGLLREVQAVKRSAGWEGVAKALEEGKLPPQVTASPPEGAVRVKLRDAGGCVEALLDLRKSARENAAACFDACKEAMEKHGRTLGLLKEARERLHRLETEGPVAPREAAPARRSRKPEWFERYRWFLSSDGNIVIAGKDAGSNDRVVKRHLKEMDAYAHADLHGAPSVVVKRDKGDIPETTLREACQFALIYSKAWAAGLASGSAYWAAPDRVSKTPETGEYLPKGAFMVRGRKNFYHDLEMKVAVGWVERGGERVLMGGPVSAVKSRSGELVVLQPGEEDPGSVASALCKRLGCGAEEARRLLPPGKSRIAEQ